VEQTVRWRTDCEELNSLKQSANAGTSNEKTANIVVIITQGFLQDSNRARYTVGIE